MASQRLNITVPEPMYEEWEKAVKSGEAASLSELIRQSVNRRLDGNLGDGMAPAQGSAELPEELADQLDRIEAGMTDLQTDVEQMTAEARSESRTTGVDLQKVVFEVLPVAPLPEKQPEDVSDELRGNYEAEALTPEEIAGRLDADMAEVFDALLKLSDDDPFVKSIKFDDTNYFWREVE